MAPRSAPLPHFAAARAGSRWPRPPRRSELRGCTSRDVPILVMGALTPGELRAALEARAEVAVWRRGLPGGLLPDGGATSAASIRLHVKLDSGMGRLGERDPGKVIELARACVEDQRLDVGGVWTHFATADEEGDAYLGEQLSAFAAGRRGGQGELAPECTSMQRQQRRDPARPRDPLRHGPLRDRRLRARSLRARPLRAGPRAGAGAALLRRRREALRGRGERGIRSDLVGARGRPGSGCCRSATAMACGAASRTTPRSSSVAAGIRSWERCRWTTSRSTSARRPTCSRAPRRS